MLPSAICITQYVLMLTTLHLVYFSHQNWAKCVVIIKLKLLCINFGYFHQLLIKAPSTMLLSRHTDSKQVCLLSQRYPQLYHPTPPLPTNLHSQHLCPTTAGKWNPLVFLWALSFFFFFTVGSIKSKQTLRGEFIQKWRKKILFSVAGVWGWFSHSAVRDKAPVIG